MGGNVDDPEAQRMVEERYYRSLEINPRRARFPCGIAWTPLPVISWLIPFIGDIGICREDGIILDFGGPNFVCVDNFAFGAVARYIQINKDKDCSVSHNSSGFEGGDQYKPDATGSKGLTWDDALHKITQEFQHHSYSLFTCNCHSFVANNLNCLGFCSGRWNVVNLATLMFLKGRWVSAAAMVRSYFPFVIVCGLGFIVGDLSFLKFLAFITFLLFGWFLLGTYCFKNLIQL